MRRREQLKMLKAIREIRAIQESAAQVAVSRANEQLREQRRRKAKTAEQLKDDQEAWLRCLEDPMAGLAVAGVWAGEVRRTEIALRQEQHNVRLAEEEKTLRNDAWTRALARAKAADALSERAGARVRSLSEEARLAELSDRVSRREVAR